MSVTISAKDVMALRQRTGMGMMECKAALNEASGDVGTAVEILRKAAKGKMDERTDRAAAEGVIAIAVAEGAAAIIELNCETDFVARNEAFTEAAENLARHVLGGPEGEVKPGDMITQIVDELRLTTKENVSFARGVKVTGPQIGSYVHHNRKVGALVAVEGGMLDQPTLAGLAQHVTAIDGIMLPVPLAIDEAGLPEDQVKAAQAEFAAEARASGKPADIADKIAAGRMRKWTEERTLLNQPYVKDMAGKTSIAQVLGEARILHFVRYQVGGGR